jgi:hypothetical protein
MRQLLPLTTRSDFGPSTCPFGEGQAVGGDLGRVLINSPCPLYPPKADITAAQTNVRFVP